MFKVVDVLKIDDKQSVTIDGACDGLKSGSKLSDSNGNVYNIVSVGMTRYDNPEDIAKYTTLLVTPCTLKKGTDLFPV